MSGHYIHEQGTEINHPIGCDCDDCKQDLYFLQQKCKLCGKPIIREDEFYETWLASDASDVWFEHARCTAKKFGWEYDS